MHVYLMCKVPAGTSVRYVHTPLGSLWEYVRVKAGDACMNIRCTEYMHVTMATGSIVCIHSTAK